MNTFALTYALLNLLATRLTTVTVLPTEAECLAKRDDILWVSLFRNSNRNASPPTPINVTSLIPCVLIDGGDSTTNMFIYEMICRLILFDGGNMEASLDYDVSNFFGNV